MSRRLLLFAKRPRLGRVKTRLVPPLDERQALDLYRAFLADSLGLLAALRSAALDVELCTDGPWEPEPALRTRLAGIPRSEQGPGDLGQRLLRAFRRSAERGASATVVVGSDSPTLPPELVEEAFRALAGGADAVLSPAEDGGYVLLGMRRPRPALLRDVPWSGGDVLGTTRRRAADACLRLTELRPWYDVDDERGLERLRRELLAEPARRRAPATARCLAALGAGGP